MDMIVSGCLLHAETKPRLGVSRAQLVPNSRHDGHRFYARDKATLCIAIALTASAWAVEVGGGRRQKSSLASIMWLSGLLASVTAEKRIHVVTDEISQPPMNSTSIAPGPTAAIARGSLCC